MTAIIDITGREILDSRGNDWYSEIFGVVTNAQRLAMMLGSICLTPLTISSVEVSPFLRTVRSAARLPSCRTTLT